MALIFTASTDLMSSQRTSRFIGPLLRSLWPSITTETIQGVQFAVRKTGHVTEYAILAWLVWRALRRPVPNDTRAWSWAPAFAAVGIAAAYAVTDEVHQSFVGSRFASPWDVAIDAAGAALAMLVVHDLFRRRRSRQPG